MSVCLAVASIADTHYRCDLVYPHAGVAHTDVTRDAAWCSHNEARKAQP